MAQGGVTCVKGIVFICNLLFALTGLLILIVGAVVQANYQHYSNFVGERIWTAPVVMIIIGAIVFITGFLGCCGAAKENSCMMLTFSILIIVIFLTEIGIAIAGYVKHAELQGILEDQFNTTLREYEKRPDYQDAWKLLQTELECCGINDPSDWKQVFHNDTLPPSCCTMVPIVGEQADRCTTDHSHQAGCLKKLLTLLDSKTLILGGVVLTVALVQLLTIFYACCLYRSFRKNYETV